MEQIDQIYTQVRFTRWTAEAPRDIISNHYNYISGDFKDSLQQKQYNSLKTEKILQIFFFS